MIDDAASVTNIAVSVGKIESAVTNLIASFGEFKNSHKDDISVLHSRADRLDLRIKALEDEAIKRQGGILSLRSLIEAIVVLVGLWFSYHMGVWK